MISGRIDFFWLPREEHHFEFYGLDIAAGHSPGEIIIEPDYRINIFGVWGRSHEATINEKALRSHSTRESDPASKPQREAAAASCCPPKTKRHFSQGQLAPLRALRKIGKVAPWGCQGYNFLRAGFFGPNSRRMVYVNSACVDGRGVVFL
jgi:hypothetical protein